MKNKIDELFEEIIQKHELDYLNDSDLKKGSLQRKNPFNPLEEKNQNVTSKQRMWTHDEEPDHRDTLPKMKDSARLRALNKLSKLTHVRKDPSTGERLFLMHRGMGQNEHDSKNTNGVTNYENGERTSWTPHSGVATSFGSKSDGTRVVSAWIPESAIVHSINQFNAPTQESIDTANKFNKPKGKEYTWEKTPKGNKIAIQKQKNRSITERDENEWIVEHRQPFRHAHPDFLDRINKDNVVSNFSNTEGYKPDFNQVIAAKQYKGVDKLSGEDRDQAFHNAITARGQIGIDNKKPKKWEKLAASENSQEDLNKEEKPFKGYNKNKHARTGGLNDKERKRINREEGRNLKRPVTGKVKAGSKAANRRKSFCARMSGVKGPTSKDGQLTPKGAALKRWKCSKAETSENDIKKSRPVIEFPNLNVPTRNEENVQIIETPKQAKLFGKKVVNKYYPPKYEGDQQVPETENRKQAYEKEANKIANSFGKTRLGVAYDGTTAAIAGKMRSKFEEGDDQYKSKMDEYNNKVKELSEDYKNKYWDWAKKVSEARASGDMEHYKNVYLQKPQKPRKPKTPSKTAKETTSLNPKQMALRGKTIDSTKVHEGLHATFGDIRKKHGENLERQIKKDLISHHDKDALQHVSNFIQKRGYNPKSKSYSEEILAHIRDILVNPAKRKSFEHMVGENSRNVINNLKRGHQKNYEYAKNFKLPEAQNEQNLPKMAASEKTNLEAIQPEHLEKEMENLSFEGKQEIWLKPKKKKKKLAKSSNNPLKALAATLILASGAHEMTNQDRERPKQAISRELASAPVDPKQQEIDNTYNAAYNEGMQIAENNRKKSILSKLPSPSGIVIQQTIRKNPDLAEKYKHAKDLSHNSLKELVEKNPEMMDDIKNRHYEKLSEKYGNDNSMISSVWHKGV